MPRREVTLAAVARNEHRFAGRVALVTGGSSGIGAATARRLLDEGARVASLDLGADAPKGVLALTADVSDSTQVDGAVARATEELGPLDILVCAAGITGASLATVDVTDDEWRRVMAIDADGVFFCNRAVLPGMVERGYGRIVNVASIAGKEGNPMATAYSSAKAAVIAMTKAIGKDVARTGVLVNCIAPAVIETPMLGGMTQEHVDVHGRAHPYGPNGHGGRGRDARMLARERGVLVLDRRDVRHLRGPGGLLMRRIVRWVDGAGRVSVGVEVDNEGHFRRLSGLEDPMPFLRGEMFSPEGRPVTPADPYSLELGDGLTLITPLDPPEVWCAGVTYERSRDARMEESAVRDVYDLVYEAHRPELFLKDAAGRRTVGPGEPIGIRGDSTWNVPEPEIGVVVGERGRILAYTIGNDVSSREIEGANPLYLSQAKVYAGACAIGPALYIPPREPQGFQIIMRISNEEGDVLYEDKTSTTYMVRTFDELAAWLVKENPVPPGSVLLTGTGLVPPDSFSLVPGNWVEIHVPEIGTLVNPVALATSLL